MDNKKLLRNVIIISGLNQANQQFLHITVAQLDPGIQGDNGIIKIPHFVIHSAGVVLLVILHTICLTFLGIAVHTLVWKEIIIIYYVIAYKVGGEEQANILVAPHGTARHRGFVPNLALIIPGDGNLPNDGHCVIAGGADAEDRYS